MLRPTHLALLALALLLVGCRSEVRYPPGPIAPNAPVQADVDDVPLLNKDEYLITPVARFEVEARVLGTERYRHGREADLSPMDLALGWGPMSDQTVVDELDISQGARFYFWKAKRLPISRGDIIRHSSNMHLIPANDTVREALMKVRRGEIVRFRGYLVNVRASDGWRWRTSTRRDDTGNGACELIWVEELMSYPGPTALDA
jgi:hypothetical protein